MKFPIAVVATIVSLLGVCAEAGKCVVTYTFDDGLADQYTIAYPMFRKAGLPATFFIIGSKVGGKMTAEQMNSLVESAKKKGEWLVFMIHGMARGYDAWENPEELEKHLDWVKEQKDVVVLSFADATIIRGNPR